MQNKKNVKVNEKIDEEILDEETADFNDCEVEENQETVNQESNTEEAESKELEQLKTKMLRLQADFLNYKNRTEKEKLNTYGNAVSDVLCELLPIVDNFERALEVEAPTKEVETFKDGMKMIETQLKNALSKRGLKEIEALGAKCDPNYHQGIAFDSESEEEEDTITEVFQKGYMVKEKVLRPSVVKIVRK